MLIKRYRNLSKLGYITDYLASNAKRQPNKLAVDFEGNQLSWSQLASRVDALSPYFLDELGNRQQKMVALLLTNSIDFIVVYLAVLQAGHMVMPLDPAYKKMELDAIVGQIYPAMVVTSPRYKTQIGSLVSVVMLDELPKEPVTKLKPLRMGPDKQIASLTFTSGTSGKPKAVPNTHTNHIWNIKACSERWDWTAKDSLLINLPLSHMHGVVICLSGAIYHGNSMYLKQQAFIAKEVLAELASGKITMYTHAPVAYAKLLEIDTKKKSDLSKVRVCISGGAPLAPAIWKEFKKRFGVEIVETYGSTETGRIAGNYLDKKVPGSPGPPMTGVELRLSKEGELLVKSPGLFPGYYLNPEATAKALSDDGYWRTGDIAELKDGNIYLKGRVQERIRRFSYTVSPRDVEWALHQHPKIQDIFVLGRQLPGEANDELIYFIVTELTDGELANFCKENLLFAWRPDKIIRLDILPRTRSGKVSIGKLKDLAGAVV